MYLAFMGLDSTYLIFIVPALLLTMYAQGKIMNEYTKYSKISSQTGLGGWQIARDILDKNGLEDVKVERIKGQLTDHYDPRDKTVRLSEGVYGSESISAMSIAAHEVGHAIQHHEEYTPLRLRTALVPIVNFAARVSWIFIIVGMISSVFLLKLGIIAFGSAVLFQIVTLPVEFNASSRALAQLEDGIAPSSTIKGSKKVLRAAALTYVAATSMAIAQLLRILVLTQDSRNND